MARTSSGVYQLPTGMWGFRYYKYKKVLKAQYT